MSRRARLPLHFDVHPVTELAGVDHAYGPALHRNQAPCRELIEDAGEMLLLDIELGGDDGFGGRQVDVEGARLRIDTATQQVLGYALRSRAHRVRLDVGDERVDLPAQASDHASGKAWIALQFDRNRIAAYEQDERVDERLGRNGIRLMREHHRFAEALPRLKNIEDLLVTTQRGEEQLHLTEDDQMHTFGAIAPIEQDRAARCTHLPGVLGDPRQLLFIQSLEERCTGKQLTNSAAVGEHHGPPLGRMPLVHFLPNSYLPNISQCQYQCKYGRCPNRPLRTAQASKEVLLGANSRKAPVSCSCSLVRGKRSTQPKMHPSMSSQRWMCAAVAAAMLSGCSVAPIRATTEGEVRRMVEAGALVGVTTPGPHDAVDARERLRQAEAALRDNDESRAWYLLEQAEVDAWLDGARDRNRLLLLIEARRSELAEKKARATVSEKVEPGASSSAAGSGLSAPPTEPRPNPSVSAAPQAAPPPGQPISTPGATSTSSWVVILGEGTFASGSAVLRATSLPVLDQLAQFLRDNLQRTVSIEGFTDNVGLAGDNLALSRRRADAVLRALVARGVARERTAVAAYGAAFPIASNTTAAGRQQNRRVELVVSDAQGRVPQRRRSESRQ